MKKLGIVAALLASMALADGERKYDFQFRQVDLRKIILSIAALEKRSVQFTQGVGAKVIDVSLKGVTTAFAMKLLTDSYGFVYILKGNVYQVMTAGERGPATAPMVLIPMKNVLVTDIEDNVRTFMGGSGSVSSNKSLNALIISAPDETVARLRPIIEQLDQETSQVYIEAKIVETSTTFSRSLGIEWGPNVQARPAVDGASFKAPGTNDTLRVGFTAGLFGSQLQARLATGEQNGEVKIISQPKVTTLNGVAANISSNITFNIRTLAATGASSASVGSIQQVKAGLQLQVTPYIVSDKRVRLQIQVTKSDPDFSAKIDGIPGVTDNSASTSLIVDSGQIASIGGLVSNRSSSATQGVPILSKIPIIGTLFGSTDRDHKETELMIFLMPSVYKGSARVIPFSTGEEISESDTGRVVSPATATDFGAAAAAAPILIPQALPLSLPGVTSSPEKGAFEPPKALVFPAPSMPAASQEAPASLFPKEGSLLPSMGVPAKPAPLIFDAAPAAKPAIAPGTAPVDLPAISAVPASSLNLPLVEIPPAVAPTASPPNILNLPPIGGLILPSFGATSSLLPPKGVSKDSATPKELLGTVAPTSNSKSDLEGALLQMPTKAPTSNAKPVLTPINNAPSPKISPPAFETPSGKQALEDLLGPINSLDSAYASPKVDGKLAPVVTSPKAAPVAPSLTPPQ